MFGVTTATVTRWTNAGRLRATKSIPGCHRRYLRADALSLLKDCGGEANTAQDRMEIDAARLYDQGWSIRQVAEQFGCGYIEMRRILLRCTTLRNQEGSPG
jgi:hypothetical protein